LPFKDKVLQRAVATILNAIYEVDFYGFFYGFRTGCHDALDALAVAIERKKVNWILDADIKGFFDSIPHDKLISFLERRIANPQDDPVTTKVAKCRGNGGRQIVQHRDRHTAVRGNFASSCERVPTLCVGSVGPTVAD
jgi:hypothetical protein